FFFFQAEDGIRDFHVTGVQTCALPISVQVEKSVENFLLYLATLRAGAVYLPLNTAYTLAELDYFISDAEPRLVVCDPAKRAGLRSEERRVGKEGRTGRLRAR